VNKLLNGGRGFRVEFDVAAVRSRLLDTANDIEYLQNSRQSIRRILHQERHFNVSFIKGKKKKFVSFLIT